MALRPVLAGRIAAAMSQQEGKQLLGELASGAWKRQRVPGPNLEALVGSVWNPDRCQVTRAMQGRQLL
jgi:hypothetical protein